VGREFHRAVDTNDQRQRAIAEEIGQALRERGLIDAIATANTETLREALLETSLGDLTEFGRAVHAEMAALLDAANHGVSVNGCTVFTTTFPCHNCARHIIAAGIRRVVYVAPYAKSKAWELHRDGIEVAEADPDPNKVQFQPFVGVAPRRYLELFDADWRERSEEHLGRTNKDTGEVAQGQTRVGRPRTTRPAPGHCRIPRPGGARRDAGEGGGRTHKPGLPREVLDEPKDEPTPEESPSAEGEQ
jgi:deoxycytidylate deaminase